MRHLCLLIGGLLLVTSAVAQAETHYSITSLGPFHASAINGSGEIIGYSLGTDPAPYCWQVSSGWIPLSVSLGRECQAWDINDSGEGVGELWPTGYPATDARAVKWTSDHSVSYLPSGVLESAYSINNSGQIVGYGWNDGRVRGRLVNPDGTVVELEPPVGYVRSQAMGISDMGRTVGVSRGVDQSVCVAVSWDSDGRVSILQSLGGNSNVPYRVNRDGVAVGYAADASSGRLHAVFWDADGGIHDLGWGSANSINNRGTVVGSSSVGATLWQDGVAANLNSLIPSGSGWYLSGAIDINDYGQIVGYGSKGAFLLTPVPEPGSLIALLGGTCFVALRVGSRCRRQ